MCGLTGFIGFGNLSESGVRDTLVSMADAISARGPDDAGYWVDPIREIAFAHRRLAVVDITASGCQPMTSADGRFTIIFNGEIYNHLSLRRNLDSCNCAPNWKGTSDTETLLECISNFGVNRVLAMTVGMFAFALWDNISNTLTLARDRFGEKPLYYGWLDKCFIFGSDLNAIRRHPSFFTSISKFSLNSYLQLGYVPAPDSIYEGISKVKPGCYLNVNYSSRAVQTVTYWSLAESAFSAITNPTKYSFDESVLELEALLTTVIRDQMIADVPIGSFLSGGVDSSVVTALMQKQSSKGVKTFSIGFDVPDLNEAVHAKAVADFLGTDHTELYVSTDMAKDVIPKLPLIYSEPFADSSQIPTFLVSKLARTKVTVALSGDGGDEIFGGYNRYLLAAKYWKLISKFPISLRRLAANCLLGIAPSRWDLMVEHLPNSLRFSAFGEKVHKLGRAINANNLTDLYSTIVSQTPEGVSLVKGIHDRHSIVDPYFALKNGLGNAETMMLLDSLTYLPDDILVKVDRAAMANSLETRAPFLDHRVFEFVWRQPFEYKIQNGVTKRLLRELLYRHIPPEIVNRPKMGFAVPLSSWIRGPLRDWSESLLAPSRIDDAGLLDSNVVQNLLKEHLSGRRNWSTLLWSLLMFQAWLHRNDI